METSEFPATESQNMTPPSPAPQVVAEPSPFQPPLGPAVEQGPFDKQPTHPLPPPSGGLAGSSLADILMVAVIVGFSLAAVIFSVYYRRNNNPPTAEEQPPLQPQPQQGTISFEELAVATSNFSEDNIIGQGGFGNVYRGTLSDGQLVAVKKLSPSNSQGDADFQAVVDVITHIHHRNLVRVVGYCIKGLESLLAYEFVPNGTLKHHLHDQGVPFMDWPKRMRVAIGTAKCLAYMHEERTPAIIHSDIKATNILLVVDFEPKVSDFGLAKYQQDTQTHVATWAMGTHGYLDPAYLASRQLTEKADVFSFGVVLLELITGRIPLDETEEYLDSLLLEAVTRPLLQGALDGHGLDLLVDRRLTDDGYNDEEMIRMVACAAACTLESPRLRPKMSQVLGVLQASLPLSILNRETPEETSEYMTGYP